MFDIESTCPNPNCGHKNSCCECSNCCFSDIVENLKSEIFSGKISIDYAITTTETIRIECRHCGRSYDIGESDNIDKLEAKMKAYFKK